MRWSQSLIPTLRQTPAEAVVPSHQWMLRAGYIQQVASGTYSYLPLGHRVLQRVMTIIRQEMDGAGAVEIFMPALQPVEWWEQTGRRAAYGQNLFVVTDRHGREQALGPTHEEVTTQLIRNSINSYRQLPITVYQIQTKFRDEFRPRFGILRSREFQMKDAYSFDLDIEGLDRSYQVMYDAYCRIFARCGLRCAIVEAESGPVGGSASHEFMIPSPTGEDTILTSDKDNYAANVEKCEIGERSHDLSGEPTGDLEQVHTPDCASIEDVSAFFKKKLKSKLKTSSMLKTLVFMATFDENEAEPWYVVAVVRGDHEVNEAKIRQFLGAKTGQSVTLELAPEELARTDGFSLGFVGPHSFEGRDDTWLLVDADAAQPAFWVAGANQVDHHVKHFNWARDVPSATTHERFAVTELRNARDGDPSPKQDGGVLQASQGIEVGHVFKLGYKYSNAMDLTVLDENQEARPVIMGCYGIGVNRIVAAAIEADDGHDDDGIIWPKSIAPFDVHITPVRYADDIKIEADRLYDELSAAGVDVLLDDRDERPGVKFKDADLIGLPLRLTIGDKGLKDGMIEFKPRASDKTDAVSLDAVVERVLEFINA